VHGPSRDVSPQPRLHILQDGTPVCVFPESKNAKQYGLFEGAEHLSPLNAYIVGLEIDELSRYF
jgi:hypothetical protein